MTTEPKVTEQPRDGTVPVTPSPTQHPVLMKAPYDPDEEEELHCECSNPTHQHR